MEQASSSFFYLGHVPALSDNAGFLKFKTYSNDEYDKVLVYVCKQYENDNLFKRYEFKRMN